MAENRELALVLKLVADQFQSELRNSQSQLSQFNNFIRDWRTQLTAVGTALFAVAKSTANFGEEALKGAQKAGQTVETFTALSYAARLADLDTQQLITGLKSLSQNMVEAAQRTGDGGAIFARLGVSAVDAANQLRPTEQVLLDLAEVFAKSADGAGKTEAAVKLFGKAGVDLIPFLNQGRDGIKELMAEAQRLGLVLSKEDAEAASKFNDELKKMTFQAQGLAHSIANPLLPQLTELLKIFRAIPTEIEKAWGEAQKFSTMLSKNFAGGPLGQGLMDLFSKMGFGHRTGEEPGAAERFIRDALGTDQKMAARRSAAAKSSAGEPEKPQIPISTVSSKADKEDEIAKAKAYQVQLGKALLEIFLTQNRALEIQKKLMREQLDLMFQQEQREDEIRQERDEGIRQQEEGLKIVQRTQAQVAEQQLAQQREILVKNRQAWVQYDEEVGASTELRYQHQIDLLRATLAQELQLTTEETGRLLIAWQNHDQQLADQVLNRTALTGQQRETVELQTLTRLAQINERASDDVFSGWAAGMKRYLRDTQTGFGLAADMARRTAQVMEQGFRTFFLDVMNGQIKSVKDAFRGLLDFVKQIISQVMAQLVTSQILKFAGAALGGGGMAFSGFGSGAAANKWFGGFASGGSFVVPGVGGTDSQRVGFMATPGERVTVETPDQQRGGGRGGAQINITIHAGQSQRESGDGASPNWSQFARQLGQMIESKLVDEQRPGGLLAGGRA